MNNSNDDDDNNNDKNSDDSWWYSSIKVMKIEDDKQLECLNCLYLYSTFIFEIQKKNYEFYLKLSAFMSILI